MHIHGIGGKAILPVGILLDVAILPVWGLLHVAILPVRVLLHVAILPVLRPLLIALVVSWRAVILLIALSRLPAVILICIGIRIAPGVAAVLLVVLPRRLPVGLLISWPLLVCLLTLRLRLLALHALYRLLVFCRLRAGFRLRIGGCRLSVISTGLIRILRLCPAVHYYIHQLVLTVFCDGLYALKLGYLPEVAQ